jgi:hypothetical protein
MMVIPTEGNMNEHEKPSPDDKQPMKQRYHMIQRALEKIIRKRQKRIADSMYIRRN